MRNLFLALVLANAALAVWRLGGTEGEPGSLEALRDTPPILLASETRRAQPRAAATPPPATDRSQEPTPSAPAAAGAAEDSSVCRSVGPFEEAEQAETFGAALREAGFEPARRAAEGEIWVGIWVYLDDVPREEADAILAELADGGIPEAYLIVGAEGGGNVISLGVFAQSARAERRRAEARALGYEPIVEEQTRPGDVYWLDVELEAGARLDLEALQPAGRILRLGQRPCLGRGRAG